MAYVVPNSTVVLLQNISLSPDYNEGTVSYASKEAQYNDMYAHKLLEWDRCTYVGKNKQTGTIRLESVQGSLMQRATYMMFKNTSYEDKWFYAFVTDVTWVNNVTWEVSFILDVMQTYQFDYTYNECFIDRMHSRTDNVGDNIIEENLETGEYIANYVDEITDYANVEPVVCCVLDHEGHQVTADDETLTFFKVDGIQIGACLYRTNKMDNVSKFFKNASEAPDSVIDYYAVPTAFATDGGDTIQIKGTASVKTKVVNKPQTSGKLYAYTPRNNKLFTYPYCYLRATDLSGNTCNYRYELFDGTTCNFEYTCTRLPNPEGFMYPTNYAGIINNYDEGLSINDFPKCSYIIDTYKAWLAQTANSRTLQQIGLGASIAAGVGLGMAGFSTAGTMGAMGAGATLNGLTVEEQISKGGQLYNAMSTGAKMSGGGLAGVLGMMARQEDHKVNSQRAVGNKSTNALTMLGQHIIQLQSMCIQQQYAKAIDSFFDKYGYKQNTIGVPNQRIRPHWTYIKTVGCNVEASLPASIVAQINEIHDAGITFWKSLDEIGNYSLDNRV